MRKSAISMDFTYIAVKSVGDIGNYNKLYSNIGMHLRTLFLKHDRRCK